MLQSNVNKADSITVTSSKPSRYLSKDWFDLLWLNLPNVIYNKILVNVMLTLPTLNLH